MSLHSKKSCTYANLPFYKGYLIPVTPFIKIEINMSKNQNKLHEDFDPTVLKEEPKEPLDKLLPFAFLTCYVVLVSQVNYNYFKFSYYLVSNLFSTIMFSK